MSRRWVHHPPCPGGCDELADECKCEKKNPLGSMTIAERMFVQELVREARASMALDRDQTFALEEPKE